MEILFDSELKKDILSMIGMDVDAENYIIDAKTKQRVIAFDGSELTIDEFGGVKKGSLVFIKNDFVSLMKIAK